MRFIINRISICLLALTCGLPVWAHSPFDCTARAIVHVDSVEVGVTVGATLGENYLRLAQLAPGQLPNGRFVKLDLRMATNFFVLTADGKIVAPRAVSVVTDGQEYQFRVEFPFAPARELSWQAKFLSALRPPAAAPFALTDEDGNIIVSAILSQEKDAVVAALPENFSSPPVAVANAPVVAPKPVENLSSVVAAPKSRPSFAEFVRLGVHHILNVGAFDHLLFLLALLLGCHRLKPMLWVITGFTLAHSLTLALAALDVVALSTRVIEPAIAASIIFVAAENFRRSEKNWQRYAITCGFGLIHGFGFAGALRESGLGGRGAELAGPLFGFNLGVEVGQLAVAAVVLPVLFGLNRSAWFARHGARVVSALVMLVAAFWLWQRLTISGD